MSSRVKLIFALALILLVALVVAGCGGGEEGQPSGQEQGEEKAQEAEKAEEATEVATYVGSEKCSTCHSDKFKSWQETMHPKMIQDATAEGVIIGDFENIPEEFADVKDVMDPEKVVYTIGSKWKQRYLVEGEDGNHYILPLQWNTAKEQWQPYHKDDWNDPSRAWEKKCAGCHTTGFDPTSLEFVEPGVGCESCHGPGSLHAKSGDKSKIVRTIDTDVCASCHNRGKAPSGEGYPVGFKPGDELTEEHYVSVTVGDKNVWDNGWAKGHHQQYLDWLLSGHAEALEGLKKNDHATDTCLNCHSADYRLAPEDAKPTLAEVTKSVNCNVCHVTHGPGVDEPQLRMAREETCTTCHNAGGEITPGEAVHHPQAEMQAGTGGLEVAAMPSIHAAAGVTCVDCHMTKVAKTINKWDISNHVFGVVTPAEAAKYEGMPDSCTTCHKDSKPEERQAVLDAWQSEIEKTLAELEPILEEAKAKVDAGVSDEVKGLYEVAFTNVSYVKADASLGAHNYQYAKKLLEVAREKLEEFKRLTQ